MTTLEEKVIEVPKCTFLKAYIKGENNLIKYFAASQIFSVSRKSLLSSVVKFRVKIIIDKNDDHALSLY